MNTIRKSLTPQQQERRETLIATVRKSLPAAIEVARALVELYEMELYKSTHGNWDRFCQELLGIQKSQAYDQLRYARVLVECEDFSGAPENKNCSVRQAVKADQIADSQQRAKAFQRLAEQAAEKPPAAEDVQTATAAALASVNKKDRTQIQSSGKRKQGRPKRQSGNELRVSRIIRTIVNLERAQRISTRVEDSEEGAAAIAAALEVWRAML